MILEREVELIFNQTLLSGVLRIAVVIKDRVFMFKADYRMESFYDMSLLGVVDKCNLPYSEKHAVLVCLDLFPKIEHIF